MQDWPNTYSVQLSPTFSVDLPLLDIGDGFFIYSFDMTGEARWNREAAAQLREKLSAYDFDGFVTVQTKSCGLTQAICTECGRDEYLELRKSRKPFMIDPVGVEVSSITTHGKQELWIGREKYARFQGKRLCFLDDVVSTGGTIDAAMELVEKIGVEISVIACVLQEGERRDAYRGIPLVSLDWIPLPGKIR
ncbi:MAG: adenine phosphoribosyltransferase [Clostridia bacterium]|nr:adenine phosphoribosyltransferase [Clostridia bacterium]